MKSRVRNLIPALLLVLAACGGGGSSNTNQAAAPDLRTAFSGTAHQKQLITLREPGQSYGPRRVMLQKDIDECNRERDRSYGLLPIAPDEAALTDIDDSYSENYFDTDKAAEYLTSRDAVLTDWQRWLRDAAQGVPAVPPDCAAITKVEGKGALIWRDGIRYTLNFDGHKGTAERSTPDFTPKAPLTQEQVNLLPQRTVMGESCHVVNDPEGPFGADDACVWDRFPAILYMGMPWVLTSVLVTDEIEQRVTTLELDKALPVDPSIFAIDPGLTITDR